MASIEDHGARILGRARAFAKSFVAPGEEPGPGPVRYLHIGKTAGTQLRHVIAEVNAVAGREVMRRERHRVTLRDIPSDAPYFFSIRNPVDRFVSGFYSRKRKGQPRTYVEWRPAEAWAYAEFAEANDLAEALFAPGVEGRKALAAMKSIQHTYRDQVGWLDDLGASLFTRPPVWIVRQETFDTDLAVLLERLGFPATVATASDSAEAQHANDYTGVPPLSDKARANLERWYAQDLAFYAACEDWMAEARNSHSPAPGRHPTRPPGQTRNQD